MYNEYGMSMELTLVQILPYNALVTLRVRVILPCSCLLTPSETGQMICGLCGQIVAKSKIYIEIYANLWGCAWLNPRRQLIPTKPQAKPCQGMSGVLSGTAWVPPGCNIPPPRHLLRRQREEEEQDEEVFVSLLAVWLLRRRRPHCVWVKPCILRRQLFGQYDNLSCSMSLWVISSPS